MSKLLSIVLIVCLAHLSQGFLFDKHSTTTKPTTTTSTTTKHGHGHGHGHGHHQSVTTPALTSSTTTTPAVNLHNPLTWTDVEVTKWLNEHKFSVFITKQLYGFTGPHLHELFLYRTQSPETFISLIKTNTVDLTAVMRFGVELRKLFSRL